MIEELTMIATLPVDEHAVKQAAREDAADHDTDKAKKDDELLITNDEGEAGPCGPADSDV